MDSKTKAALSYVFGWITGTIFLIIEKDDYFVRKNAAQAFTIGIIFLILKNAAYLIPFIGFKIHSFISLGHILLSVVMIIKAMSYECLHIPIITNFAEEYVLKWFY